MRDPPVSSSIVFESILMPQLLRDSDWVRQSFLITDSDLENVDFQNRTFSSASLKFVDTTPGGNFAINPPAQFTRTADIKSIGRFSGSVGLGRYYSEAIDDNSQVIHMRFGVPQFNSLTSFFAHFYNTGAGQLARTGRADSAFFQLGRAAGFIVSILSWQILAIHLLGTGIKAATNFLGQKPSSKFYYLKPTMPLYWNAVHTIVNQVAVNRGIVPRLGGDRQSPQERLNDGYKFDEDAITRLNEMLPDVFTLGRGIDVMALAGRAQRLQRKHLKKMQEVINAATDMNLNTSMDDLSKRLQIINKEYLEDSKPSFGDYLAKWLGNTVSTPSTGDDGSKVSTSTESLEEDKPRNSSFFEFYESELDDGAAFASFRVNSTGTVQENFSNSVVDSELQGKINGMASQARSTNFNFANGNIVGGAVGSLIGGVTQAVKDVVGGVMQQLNVSGLAVLGGGAFVDIPKHWQSSVAQLPRASYTINLVSPYGNPISQLVNLHIPLAMLLAGALPLSTGKQSYTSPFLVELYDKGRCQTRLGMIDSLSVTRGTGNLGFSSDGHVMGIDVTFSIVDLSSILHMPISQGFSMDGLTTGATAGVIGGAVAGGSVGGVAGAAAGAVTGAAVGAGLGAGVDAAANAVKAVKGVFDEDTAFTDYMAVISGLGLSDQIYSFNKLKLNLTRSMTNWRSFYSASNFASFAGDVMPSRMVSALFKGTAR